MFSTSMPRLWNNGVRTTPQDQELHQHRSNFKSALEHIFVPGDLLRGINVFKVTSKGKLEPATLTISNDKFIISVLPRTLKLDRVNSNGISSLKRPSILSRARSGTSAGSIGGSGTTGGSIGTNSVDGMDAAFSFNPQSVVDIGSIDRIQSGQNTLLFEKARCVYLLTNYNHVHCCTHIISQISYKYVLLPFAMCMQTTGKEANDVSCPQRHPPSR